jgi:hypothetical protein
MILSQVTVLIESYHRHHHQSSHSITAIGPEPLRTLGSGAATTQEGALLQKGPRFYMFHVRQPNGPAVM